MKMIFLSVYWQARLDYLDDYRLFDIVSTIHYYLMTCLPAHFDYDKHIHLPVIKKIDLLISLPIWILWAGYWHHFDDIIVRLFHDIIHPCLKSAPEERLHDFSVGLTMTNPTTFPYHPSATSSVMSYLKVCCQHQGAAARVTLLNCTQAVWGRFLVITLPGIRGKVTLAEVIVDSDGKCALLIQNGAELTSTLQTYLFGDQPVF